MEYEKRSVVIAAIRLGHTTMPSLLQLSWLPERAMHLNGRKMQANQSKHLYGLQGLNLILILNSRHHSHYRVYYCRI